MNPERFKCAKFTAHVESLLKEQSNNNNNNNNNDDEVFIVVPPPQFKYYDIAVVSNKKLLLLRLRARSYTIDDENRSLYLDTQNKPFGLDKNNIHYAYITNHNAPLAPRPNGFKYAALAANVRRVHVSPCGLFQPYTLTDAERIISSQQHGGMRNKTQY